MLPSPNLTGVSRKLKRAIMARSESQVTSDGSMTKKENKGTKGKRSLWQPGGENGNPTAPPRGRGEKTMVH